MANGYFRNGVSARGSSCLGVLRTYTTYTHEHRQPLATHINEPREHVQMCPGSSPAGGSKTKSKDK
jgi:hypothetical protein